VARLVNRFTTSQGELRCTQALFESGSVHLVITAREPQNNMLEICGIMRSTILAVILGCPVAVTAAIAVGETVSASGDNNMWHHGESDGYYDENNINPFPDDRSPGLSQQNGSGA